MTSTTASRELVQAMSVLYALPVLVLHDFDVSGFTIFGTLGKSTRRFKYDKPPKVVDLGLRMADIDGLESELVRVKSRSKTRATLRRHGAAEEEIDFLVPRDGRDGRRVELNAMTSDQLVGCLWTWLDPKTNGRVYDYNEVARLSLAEPPPPYPLIKTAVPGWDNDPRRQGDGLVLHGATPAKYQSMPAPP